MSTKQPGPCGSDSSAVLGRIRVEYKSEVLGDGVFWEGPATAVAEIHNIPARETAQMVAEDGKARAYGMWHVSMLPAA
jgi:hypothetical protein